MSHCLLKNNMNNINLMCGMKKKKEMKRERKKAEPANIMYKKRDLLMTIDVRS